MTSPIPSHRHLVALLLALAPLAGRAMPGAGGPAAAGARPQAKLVFKDGRVVSLFSEANAAMPVARVGDEVVTVRDLGEAIATAHAGGGGRAGARDLGPLVDRLVDVRLVALEARAMGLEDQPEFTQQMDQFETSALRDFLRREAAKGARVSAADVDRRYRAAAREWTIRSALFAKEADARAAEAAVRGGTAFATVVAKALAAGTAQGKPEPERLRESKMLPEIAAAVRALQVGAVSKPVKLQGGWALLRVEGQGVAKDPETRAAIEADLRNSQQVKLVQALTEDLIRRRARIDKAMLAKVDYEARQPGLEALRSDPRPLAAIEGGPPFTVADLTNALERKLFHGADQAAESKRLNAQKESALHTALGNLLLLQEARRRGLDRTAEFRYVLGERRRSLAFGLALQRAVLPEVTVTDADVAAYYERHASEYQFPAFYRLEGLGFGTRAAAEAALRQLRTGTDFGWLRPNAEGQLAPERQALPLGGLPVDASTLPPALAAELAGAKTGDVRLVGHEGGWYVVRALEVIPPRRQPLDELREALQKRVLGEKTQAALAEWTARLRQHYPVEVLVARVE